MVPEDDQAMVLPCASVMVIMVLLKDALTCATPEAMFLRSRRRTRVASLPILDPLAARFLEPWLFANLGTATVAAVTWPNDWSCRSAAALAPAASNRIASPELTSS